MDTTHETIDATPPPAAPLAGHTPAERAANAVLAAVFDRCTLRDGCSSRGMFSELTGIIDRETAAALSRAAPGGDSGHTEGPWEVRELDNDKLCPTLTVTGRTRSGHPVYVARVDRKEDARLIAAAPDLAEALRDILADLGEEAFRRNDHIPERLADARRRARSALASAEGRA